MSGDVRDYRCDLHGCVNLKQAVAPEDVVAGISAADGTFASTITIPAVAADNHDLLVVSVSSSAKLPQHIRVEWRRPADNSQPPR